MKKREWEAKDIGESKGGAQESVPPCNAQKRRLRERKTNFVTKYLKD